MSTPRVSVLMLVYQHQEFVAQAIESVLSQQCDFAFELIIINDCSTDSSGSICRTYAQQNPQTIRFIDNPHNIGMHDSFATLWSASSAKLVAFCEGDDFWIDQRKLQQQVDLLDKFSNWALCGAQAQIIELSQTGNWEVTSQLKPSIEKDEYGFKELIQSYHFHFSTIMLRKSSVEFPSWFKSVYCVDRPLYLLAAQNGSAGYLQRVVSNYRVHENGNWSSLSGLTKAEQSSDLFTKFLHHFPAKYQCDFANTLFNILQSYAAQEMAQNRYDNARRIFKMSFSQLTLLERLISLARYYRTAILLTVKR